MILLNPNGEPYALITAEVVDGGYMIRWHDGTEMVFRPGETMEATVTLNFTDVGIEEWRGAWLQ